jgi:hypothetical protein
LNCVFWCEFEETELAEVGDEDQSILAEVAEGLRFVGEGVETIFGGLDFYDAAFGIPKWLGFGGAALAFGLGKEAAVGQTRSAVTKLGGKEDGGVEGLTGGIEETVNGRVVRGLGGRRAGRTDGPEIGEVLSDGVDVGHVASNDCTGVGRGWVRSLVRLG